MLGKEFSTREVDVIKEILKGVTNKQAAGNLYITEKTVKFHLTNIYKKLGINSRSQLITKYFNGGFDVKFESEGTEDSNRSNEESGLVSGIQNNFT